MVNTIGAAYPCPWERINIPKAAVRTSRSRMVALSGTAAPTGSAASSCSILVCGEAVGETVGAAVGLVGLVVGMDVGLVGATVGPDVGLVGVLRNHYRGAENLGGEELTAGYKARNTTY